MFLIQVAAFFLLPLTTAFAVFAVLAFVGLLMAIGTLVFGTGSYQNVVCLGLLVDERGDHPEY